MTTAQVVETSVTVNNHIPIQDYVHPDDQPTFKMTPGFKPVSNNGYVFVTLKINFDGHRQLCPLNVVETLDPHITDLFMHLNPLRQLPIQF